MPHFFRITNARTGHDFGVFCGDTTDEALDAFYFSQDIPTDPDAEVDDVKVKPLGPDEITDEDMLHAWDAYDAMMEG